MSGLFTSKYEDFASSSNDSSLYQGIGLGYMKPEPNMKIEDEEDLLYGESGSAFKMNSVAVCYIFQSICFLSLQLHADGRYGITIENQEL